MGIVIMVHLSKGCCGLNEIEMEHVKCQYGVRPINASNF
jgi:hypothetical protein